jgi:hypothetical protein
MDDEGDVVPLLLLGVLSREELPTNPWGARWVKEDQLGILAEDWSEDPQVVATKIIDFAVEAARRESRARSERLVSALEEE